MSAIALVMITGQAAIAQDKPVTLEYKFKQGDTFRSKVTINTSVMGTDVVVNATSKTEIKEIKKNGDIVVVSTSEGGKVKLGDMEQDQPAQPPVTTTRSKLGKVVEYKAEDVPMSILAPEIQKLAAVLNEQIFGEKPVKKDDTWTTEVENPAVKEKKITVKGTYLGTETVEGKELWKVKQTADAVVDKDGAKMSIEMTSWINPENGQLVKGEGTVKDLPTQFGPMTWNMKMELVKK
jgi:hypothetical protein